MAFTSSFKYDIFISYSHIDNHAPEGKTGWVDEFHAELESWLVRRFGHQKIKIWRDKELRGNTLFDNRIKEIIDNSVLFLTLYSSNYFDSDYCRKELDWFYRQAKASNYGLSVKDECRLFNILLKNIQYTSWPVELSGASSFPVHDALENSDDPGEPIDPRDRQFKKKLRKIIDAIETTLKAFPGSGQDRAGAEKEDQFSIFIADVPDTLQTARDRLIADLKDKSVRILDEIPPPMGSVEHEKSATNAIKKARLSIHLLDELPGRKITDLKTTTYPCRQVEIGLHSDTQQLIWVPKHLQWENIEDEDYRAFLQSLENDAREGKTYEFIRDQKTYLPDLILEKIAQIQQKRRDEADIASILLDTHQKDQRFAFKLADYLSSKGLEIEFNQESRDPLSSLHNFEEYLQHAVSLVIIFGQVAPAWILERLKKTIKLISTQLIDLNKTTLENRWIYLLPSSKITGEIDNLAKEFRINFLDNTHTSKLDESVVEQLLKGSREVVNV